MASAGTSRQQVIYAHIKCPDWGYAKLKLDSGDKRTFLFEDGKERVFKRGYYELLRPVDAPVDQAARTLARLGDDEGATTFAAATRAASALPFQAQIMAFEALFPNGFAGEPWKQKKRAAGASKRLKRHREPAIAEMGAIVEDARRGEAATLLVDRVADLLASTDLVSNPQLASLLLAGPAQRQRIVTALLEILDNEEMALPVRFERYFTTLENTTSETRTSWSTATAILALASPQEHICVRPASFQRQAEWMAPRLAGERRVTGRLYQRWLKMVENVSAALIEAELTPADFFDIYDFIVETMKPKTVQLARKLYTSRQ